MARLFPSLCSLAVLLLTGACASIVEGSTDPITVATSSASPSACVLTNARGAWNGATAAPILVKRSRSDLSVSCVDSAQGTRGETVLASDVEAWTFGNIIIGGLVGLVVDWSTGAAYTYPDHVTVEMRSALLPASVTQGMPPAPATSLAVDIITPQVETVYDEPQAGGIIAVPPVFVVPGRVY